MGEELNKHEPRLLEGLQENELPRLAWKDIQVKIVYLCLEYAYIPCRILTPPL